MLSSPKPRRRACLCSTSSIISSARRRLLDTSVRWKSRIREACFAESRTLEGFDWKFNPKAFDRLQIEELATGDFIRRRANLVFVGWSGVGKSHIIQALGQKACVHGYRVCYRTSAAFALLVVEVAPRSRRNSVVSHVAALSSWSSWANSELPIRGLYASASHSFAASISERSKYLILAMVNGLHTLAIHFSQALSPTSAIRSILV